MGSLFKAPAMPAPPPPPAPAPEVPKYDDTVREKEVEDHLPF